jgi:hypothetical protein
MFHGGAASSSATLGFVQRKIALALVLALASCERREASGSRPAASPWSAPTGTTTPAPSLVPFDLPVEPFPRVVSTVAGVLTIVEPPGCGIMLGARAILVPGCQESIEAVKHFANGLMPFDEVVVLQEVSMGNACNGGPIWFLGLRRDGTFELSKPLDFCGGKDAVIRPEPGRITVFIPGGTPNRPVNPTDYIPSETWAFQQGQLAQLSGEPGGPSFAQGGASAPPTSSQLPLGLPPEPEYLPPEHPYSKGLQAWILGIVHPRPPCETGWTGGVEVTVRNGKIVAFDYGEDAPPFAASKSMIGKPFPKPPPEFEAFFQGPVVLGLCVPYVAYRSR